MEHGITYDLDLNNETEIRFRLSQGQEICIYHEETDETEWPQEITVSVVKGDLGLCWYADLFSNNDSRLEEFGTKEDALDHVMGWVRIYRDKGVTENV